MVDTMAHGAKLDTDRRKMKADLEEVKGKLSSDRDPMELAAECIEKVLREPSNAERAHAN